MSHSQPMAVDDRMLTYPICTASVYVPMSTTSTVIGVSLDPSSDSYLNPPVPLKSELEESTNRDNNMIAAQWQSDFDPQPSGSSLNWNEDAGLGLFSEPSLELSSPSAWPQEDLNDQSQAIKTAMATDPLANMDWQQQLQENNMSILSPNSTVTFPTPPLLFDSDPIQTPATVPIAAVAAITLPTEVSKPGNPTSGLAASTSTPCRLVKPVACIRCRSRKISCDALRPCTRCFHAGTACLDRTEEDIQAAKKRQGKRKPAEGNDAADAAASIQSSNHQTTILAPNFPVAPIPPTMPAASYPADSFEAYSALTLQAALRLHHMPLLWWLYEHVQVNSRTAELARVFQWKTCLETYLAGVCDVLTVSDSGLLLSTGLSREILHSPEWMRSPFARYVQPATRRLYHEVSSQQSPTCCFNGDLRFYYPSLVDPNRPQLQTDLHANAPAQLLVEWLPEAQTAWNQLESLDASQALFDRSALKRQRIGCSSIDIATNSALQSDLTANEENLPFLNEIATKLAHKLIYGDTEAMKISSGATPSTVTASSSSHSNPPSSSSASSCSSSDHETLNSHFGRVMSVSDGHQPDAATMALNTNMPRVYQHATWCPRHHAWNSHSSPAKQEANPTASVASLSTTTYAAICLCSLSTPFPCRVIVNSAFERVTGWSQQEIVSQWSSEYLAAIRELLHPSGWTNFVADLQEQRMYAFNLLREAIRSAEGEPVDIDTLKSVAQRNPDRGAVEVRPFCSNSFLRNKWSGQPVPCLMTKFMGHEVEGGNEDQDQSSTPSSNGTLAAVDTNSLSVTPRPPRPRRFFGFIIQLEVK